MLVLGRGGQMSPCCQRGADKYLHDFYQKTQEIASIGEDVKKMSPQYTLLGIVNWCSHYEKQYRVPQKNKVKLYNPVIPLLGIYQRKIIH